MRPRSLARAFCRAARQRQFLADAPSDASLTLTPIGVVRSPYTLRAECPRQATAPPPGGSSPPAHAQILLNVGLEDSVRDLAGFSHVWLLFHFHLNPGWSRLVRPPPGGGGVRGALERPSRPVGVLSTRSPDRPNPIGLSALRLLRADGLTLEVDALDVLDGTPVLDVKPYIPYADAVPDARAGWLDT